MRASIAVLAFVAAASATAFKRQGIPACAMQCMGSANFDGCDPTDNACLCKSDTFVESTYQCITTTCKGDDLDAAVAGARALCAASGVTLTQTIPGSSTAAPTATSPAGSGSGSASVPATSTAASTPSTTPNSAAAFAGVSGMAGAVAAVAGVLFAL